MGGTPALNTEDRQSLDKPSVQAERVREASAQLSHVLAPDGSITAETEQGGRNALIQAQLHAAMIASVEKNSYVPTVGKRPWTKGGTHE